MHADFLSAPTGAHESDFGVVAMTQLCHAMLNVFRSLYRHRIRIFAIYWTFQWWIKAVHFRKMHISMINVSNIFTWLISKFARAAWTRN